MGVQGEFGCFARGHLEAEEREVTLFEDVVDHPLEAETPSVFRMVDPADAVGFEFAFFLGDDRAAAAAEDLDMARASLDEEIAHVLEILHMAALVAADGDTLGILLDRRVDDL